MNISDVKTIAILGRQPALGIAELESLYGSEHILPYGKHGCFADIPYQDIDFQRLGGSVRLTTLVAPLPSTSWQAIEKYLIKHIPDTLEHSTGKISYGLSVYGLSVSGKNVAKTALLLKKAIKATGVSVRMVPHKNTELGSATVLYNKLTSENGREYVVVSNGSSAYLAQTVCIQDIDAYAERDQARPHRDAKVGMLPPKLAQIIINLAVGNINQLKKSKSDTLILDPFCGTGVLLQEATLMDYDVFGTDLEPRMVQYSIDNLTWLDAQYPDRGDYRRVEVGDATKHKWHNPEKITNVAGETYLGQPLSSLPNSEHLSTIMHDVNQLHHRFLHNIGQQILPGTRLCLAIPTWRGKHEFLHLSVLDYLDDLGYTRMSFKHVANEDLIYHRENQVVGRELLVLEKR